MSNSRPPKWADRFLRWYCNPKYLEEIQGDVYELFDMRLEEKGKAMANRKFIWDVFRFFRWSNIKRSSSKHQKMNQFGLFQNYLKLGVRNINRNPVTSSINIFGLAIAIGIAITVYFFVDIQFNMNRFHSKRDRIYQIFNHVEQEGDNSLWSDTPLLLGPRIAADLSSVEATARLEYANAIVRFEEEVFDEWIAFTDPVYLEIFDFPILYGNKQALYKKDQIAISHDMAVKYFDLEDPLGKELSMVFSNGEKRRFEVGAVMDKFLYNDNLRHHFYIPIDNFYDLKFQDHYNWSYFTDATFVLLNEGQDIETLQRSYEDWISLQHGSNPEWLIKDYESISLNEVALRSYNIHGAIGWDLHPTGRNSFIIMACLLMGMACFNFMNIAVTGAAKRLKEIGLRKVMGGAKRQIIDQFLVENVLQCFLALIVGTFLAYFLFVPGFDSIVPIDLQFRAFSPLNMVVFFILLLLLVGLLSGTYPAFYISRFDPVTIFKGNQKFGAGNAFSKMLLGFQLFLAFLAIVASIVLTDQLYHFTTRDWGYNPSGTLFVKITGDQQYEKLRNALLDHPNVEGIGGSTAQIGNSLPMKSIDYFDRKIAVRAFGASEDYFNVLMLRLKKGRFLTDQPIDQETAVVVNQKFVDQMEWKEPINKTFTLDSVRRTVVGVVGDFHYDQFFSPIDPVIIHGVDGRAINYLSVKTQLEELSTVDSQLKKAWIDITPNDPYQRFFQEDVFDDFFENNTANIKISIFISCVALILACLGLYGLLSFNIQKKLKEFGIRKVLGATPRAIIKVAGKQYSWIVLLAFALGAPLGFFVVDTITKTLFPDPNEVSVVPFVFSFFIIVVTFTITVLGQVRKAIRVNPASILRSE